MHKSSAFSLVELSIVILVIGILVAGVTSGSRLVSEFQLTTARTLTKSSPVAGIKDLMLWYETSLESSFKSSERTNNSQISVWYDINPQKPVKNSANQVSTTQNPLFIEGAFPNNIPGIRFDGTNDRLSFDGTFLVNTSYTIFIVEQRRSSKSNNTFISGNAAVTLSNLLLSYSSDSSVKFGHYSFDIIYTVSSFISPTPVINTFYFNNGVEKKYWRNANSYYSALNLIRTQPLIAFAGATIGGGLSWGSFDGDIAEAIMYSRNLTDEERSSIEKYLSKKYKITLG